MFIDNSCCNGGDSQLITARLAAIQPLIASSDECLANFNEAFCGLTCSPEQYPSRVWLPLTQPRNDFVYVNASEGCLVWNVCASFCTLWYASCSSTELGELFDSAEAFCLGNAPPGMKVQVVNDTVYCFGGIIDDINFQLSYAVTSQGSAGVENTFLIQAVNQDGNKRQTGGDRFNVTMQLAGNAPLFTTLVDNQDGTYSVLYTPTVAGLYTVTVQSLTWTPIELQNSPFPLNVVAGKHQRYQRVMLYQEPQVQALKSLA